MIDEIQNCKSVHLSTFLIGTFSLHINAYLIVKQHNLSLLQSIVAIAFAKRKFVNVISSKDAM